MSLDLRDLRCFFAVATHGSISRAALTLHVSQPALSVRIKAIEEKLGHPMFERLPKRMVLTDAGKLLLTHAKDILRRMELAVEEIGQRVSVPVGHVALGLPQSIARFLTVPLVTTVLARWPQIRFQIVELSSGYIPEHLKKGDIDIGMTFGKDEHQGLHYTHLIDEELVFVSSAAQIRQCLGAAGLRRKTIPLADIARFPIILPTATHSLRVLLDDCLQRTSQNFSIVAEVNTTPQLIGLAAANVGSTILSYAAVVGDTSAQGVRIFRIEKPRLTRAVYLCTYPSMPKTIGVMAVMHLLVDTVNNLATQTVWPTRMAP